MTANRSLRASKRNASNKKRLEVILENSSEGVTFLGQDGKYKYASPSVRKLLGYSPEDYLKRKFSDSLHPSQAKKIESLLKGLKPGQSVTYERKAKHKNGSWRWLEVTATNLINDPEVNSIVFNFHDITARKELENQKDRIFRAIIERSSDGVTFVDKNGRYKYVSPSVKDLLGYTPEEFMNLKFPDLLHPSEAKRIRKIFNSVKPGESVVYERRGKCKNGKYKWFEVTVTNMLDDPKVQAIVSNFHDITERKKLEKKKDEFIGIASHELKTPLTSVKGFTQILRQLADKIDKATLIKYLEKTNRYVDKLDGLINDLLDISKIQAGKLQLNFSKFNIYDLIKETAENIQSTSNSHKIVIRGSKNAMVEADPERIEQVISNLLINAIKYSPDSNKVEILIAKDNKGNAVVSIKDQGVGIPAEDIPKLFHRFFRVEKTEKEFSGLGIGLFIAHEIIERHKGAIWVESIEGKGSTFYFSIPIKRK